MRRKDLLQFTKIISPRKFLERFASAIPASEIDAENPLDRGNKFAGGKSGKDLTANFAMAPKTTADKDMVGVDTLPIDSGFGPETADVAYVMLSTGIWTSCDMNVDRLIKLDSFLERLN